jgi:hypothetical protein
LLQCWSNAIFKCSVEGISAREAYSDESVETTDQVVAMTLWTARGTDPFWDNSEYFDFEAETVDEAVDTALDIGEENGWQVTDLSSEDDQYVSLGPVEREVVWADLLLEIDGQITEDSLPGLTASMILDLAELLWGVSAVLAIRAEGVTSRCRPQRCSQDDIPAPWHAWTLGDY